MEMKKENYKILLIAVNGAWKHGNIGIDQLTGYLRTKGFNVDVAYFRTGDAVEIIFEKVKDGYDFYGFSVTSSNIAICHKLAELIKSYRNEAIIDFGGGYVTRYYREVFCENDRIDFMTLGDGEVPTEILLERIISDSAYIHGKSTDHPSIASKIDTEDKIHYTNTIIDYHPAYDYYETDSAVRNSRKVHCIQTKNNVCTGNCSFCTERHGKVCYKNISHIIDEIKHVHLKYGVQKIFFTDDNIFDPNDSAGKEHVKSLCLELLKLKNEFGFKLVYQCYIKAISLHDTPEDNEILSLMKEVGFVEVFVGIESANESDLQLYNKHTTVEDNYVIIDLIKRHGLFPIMGFIAFNPYTTFEKIENNFRFLCDVECTYLPNYLYSFVNMNKYTALYELTKKDGLVLSSDDVYTNISYRYMDDKVTSILNYVETEMLERLKEIQYETDWIIYSYMEHCILYDIEDYSKELANIKEKDLSVIKKYLSILFTEHNLEKFKKEENKFWDHFLSQQERIKTIYRSLMKKHTVSSCLPVYARQLGVDDEIETRKCNDVTVGEIKGSVADFWFDKNLRIKNNLEIPDKSGLKTVVIILESPHTAEYDGDFVSPALGTTGRNLQKHFYDIFKSICNEGEYRVILMNSIQYQCSLRMEPNKFRDNMWLKLWFKENLRNNFIKRLISYEPDIIFNFCTCGSHTLESNLPKGCKSSLNKKYIERCIAPLEFGGESPSSLRMLVTDAITESGVKAEIYEGSHPSAWRIRNDAFPDSKKYFVLTET